MARLLLQVSTILFSIIFLHNFAECAKQKKTKESLSAQLEQKVQNLIDLNTRRPVIRMNAEKFRQYVRTSPKNYSVILMLTALSPDRQCAICKEVNMEFQILGSSWKYSNGYASNKLFFAVVDYDEGSEVFNLLKKNSAPIILHFPAKGRQRNEDTYDMSRQGFSAEQIAKWVADRTDVSIHIVRPPNYLMAITIGLLLAGIGALLYIKRKSLEIFYNRDYWAVFAMAIVFVMISGQMWNHIRGPPYAHRNPSTGEISYIHGSGDGQLVAETYIVFVLYACISFGFIMLNDSAMSQTDVTKRRVFTVIGLAVVVLFFSLILSIFRNKYHGYPYSFLIK